MLVVFWVLLGSKAQEFVQESKVSSGCCGRERAELRSRLLTCPRCNSVALSTEWSWHQLWKGDATRFLID